MNRELSLLHVIAGFCGGLVIAFPAGLFLAAIMATNNDDDAEVQRQLESQVKSLTADVTKYQKHAKTYKAASEKTAKITEEWDAAIREYQARLNELSNAKTLGISLGQVKELLANWPFTEHNEMVAENGKKSQTLQHGTLYVQLWGEADELEAISVFAPATDSAWGDIVSVLFARITPDWDLREKNNWLATAMLATKDYRGSSLTKLIHDINVSSWYSPELNIVHISFTKDE